MATSACCHAARAAAIEKIAHCVVSDPFLYSGATFFAAREGGRPSAGRCGMRKPVAGAFVSAGNGRAHARASASRPRRPAHRARARSVDQWLRAYPWISARIIPSTVASSRSASCSDSSTSAA
ncbi:hypothetical protein DID97_28240 [Burkholderia sp. Bp8977]|nr:hypothetical protein DIE10_29680 [Burkholderia sp. Bp9011]RQR86214.1 hypothetical protein DIE09_30645 [Burkholderia sp. Bp9010]RQS00998.1 hypothetical protein DIE02_26785 [Burkholderia sp. Bp8991]RQS67625.1 hypothetical protein DID97_28240 [Burkholderia sp. Bp8977]